MTLCTPFRWAFVPETHTYLVDGREVRSVTQILNDVGLINYDLVPQAVLDRKAQIGTAAHAASWYLDQNDLNWETVAPEVEPYVLGWDKCMHEVDFIPDEDGIEKRGIAELDGFRYGFTLDRKGRFCGRPAILEIKCTAAVEVSWGPQLSAYESAEFARDGVRRIRVVVHLKPNETYELHPYDDVRDYQVFRWALRIVNSTDDAECIDALASLRAWRRSKRGSYGYGSRRF